MKKKLVAVLLCLTLAFSVTGCGKDKKSESVENTESTEVVSSAAIDFDPLDYVELGDYMGLSVALTDDYSVSDDDVKTFIENSVITNYPYYADTDKTVVEDGDAVNIDYEGLKDGVAFSGGTATDTVLEIGSNTFIDGFEEGLIGAKVGDKVTLNLFFNVIPEEGMQASIYETAALYYVMREKGRTYKIEYKRFSAFV